MGSKPPFEIEEDAYWPPRKYGRNRGNNNDAALVALALEGLENNTYKSYAHAARELEPQSKEYGKGYKQIGVLASRAQRLQRAIGKAYRLKHGCSIIEMRARIR